MVRRSSSGSPSIKISNGESTNHVVKAVLPLPICLMVRSNSVDFLLVQTCIWWMHVCCTSTKIIEYIPAWRGPYSIPIPFTTQIRICACPLLSFFYRDHAIPNLALVQTTHVRDDKSTLVVPHLRRNDQASDAGVVVFRFILPDRESFSAVCGCRD